jgi:hypothetical protein
MQGPRDIITSPHADSTVGTDQSTTMSALRGVISMANGHLFGLVDHLAPFKTDRAPLLLPVKSAILIRLQAYAVLPPTVFKSS